MALTIENYQQFVLDTITEYQGKTESYAGTADDILSTLFTGGGAPAQSSLDLLEFLGEEQFVDAQGNFKDVVDLREEFALKHTQTYDALKAAVPTQLSYFLTNYFPKPTEFDQIEQFLVDSVLNGGMSLPDEVEQQIYFKAKKKVDIETNKAIRDMRKSVASRGFIVPSGVESYQESIMINEGSKNNAQVISDIAIASAKEKIEWVKFAVGEARNYRSVALDSAFKYMQSVLSTHDTALKYSVSYVDSYKTFYDSMNTYFSAINNINRLKFEKANAQSNLGLEWNKNVFNKDFSRTKLQQDTALDLVRSMTQNTSAALSAINTVATVTQAL
jgi:virulence-associated protein VapD